MPLQNIIRRLIRSGVVHGYDIGGVLEKSLGFARQTVYSHLNKMARTGQVHCQLVSGDGSRPSRKEYELIDTVIEPLYADPTSFNGTSTAYMLLAHDIDHGTNYHAEYVKHMHQQERKFLTERGFVYGSEDEIKEKGDERECSLEKA